MMRALPEVTFVGTPTRGGSGGGGRFLLPLGSIVNYPDRWLFSPQGELIDDDRGLVPDIIIESGPSLDPVFEGGLRVLREKIASEGG
jgi:C-terminal processing protease CtpA/Prc